MRLNLKAIANYSRIQFLFSNKGNCSNSTYYSFLIKRKMETIITPTRKELKFEHYRQQYEWDCGLSCILMILSYKQRDYFVKNFEDICRQEGFGYSTWTIDLCYVLKRFNIKHVYFTKTIGVDPSYGTNNYYKNIIIKDTERVNTRFQNAESNGIIVDKKRVGFDAFIKHLSIDGPIIVLTNSRLLYCEICHPIQNENENIFNENNSYTGHYVLLVGYDLLRNKIFYRNPAKENHVCISSISLMDKARTAFGTDEDVIFIFL